MKTILYILIALLIGSNLFIGIPQRQSRSGLTIYLSCMEKYPEKELMTESAEIIRKRLTDAGTNVLVTEEENNLRLDFQEASDFEKVRNFLTAQGRFAFHETLNKDDLMTTGIDKDSLRLGLNSHDIAVNIDDMFNPVVGSVDEADITSVTAYLNSTERFGSSDSTILFAWDYFSGEDQQRELYMLRRDAFLHGSHITRAYLDTKKENSETIFFNFDKPGTEIWSVYTQKNLNRPVAFVLDGAVYFCPLVRESVNGGKCAISGNFSELETRSLMVLMNNDPLPLKFTFME